MVSPNKQYRLQGWAVSTFVHGLALTVALGLMTQVKPVVPQDTFKWDVALVEPQRNHESNQAEIKPVQEPAKPTPRSVTPAPIQPKKVTPVVQHEIRQPIETIQPIQQTMAVQTKTEPVPPVIEQQTQEVQPTEQSVDESVIPVVQQEAATQPVITEAPAIETASVTRDFNPPTPPAPETAAVIDAKPAESVARESLPKMAMATSTTPAVKADYGWLAESLRRRLAEIKRYPRPRASMAGKGRSCCAQSFEPMANCRK